MNKLLITFALLVVLPAFASSIKDVEDLRALAAEAGKQGGVCAVYVYREGCPYCRALESEVLRPMSAGGEFDSLCMMRLNWEGSQITDFNGSEVSSEDLVRRFGIVVVPTIVFIDSAGEPLTEPLIGYQGSELYFALLRKRYRQAADFLSEKLR